MVCFRRKHYSDGALSQFETADTQKKNMGLIMFIVGFLGLTFLITSGCILYFKQMGECEDEKADYTILRKLGFTTGGSAERHPPEAGVSFRDSARSRAVPQLFCRSVRMVFIRNGSVDADDHRHGAVYAAVLHLRHAVGAIL